MSSPPGLARNRATMASDLSMPATRTPRSASSARVSTTGVTTAGSNMPAASRSYRDATRSPKNPSSLPWSAGTQAAYQEESPDHPGDAGRTMPMPRSAPVDGFGLAYDRHGAGDPVVLLHGWPGDRTDYDAVVPELADHADVVVPDLRGFGASDKHPAPAADAYSATAQARSVLGLLDELGLHAPVLAGYDIGSRIAQAVAGQASDR